MGISRQLVYFSLRVSIAIVLIGVLFKIIHWPYGGLFIAVGTIGMAIFYSIKFYQKRNKQLLDYAKLVLLISFLPHYTFSVMHLDYGHVFTSITRIALSVFIVLYIKDVLFNTLENSENATLTSNFLRTNSNSLLYGFATICIVIGALLKILHWEFSFVNGSLLLFLGLSTVALSLFLGPKT